MNTRSTVVETSLNQAEFRWKFLRLLLQSSVLGISICLLALSFGVAILAGWVADKSVAFTFFALVGGLGLVIWGIVLIRVAVVTPDRRWLAASVERGDRRLLDRLNTLLFLEGRRREPPTEGFAVRIAGQTQRVLAEHAPPSPFSARRALTYLLAFLVILTATILLYQRYAPWQLLVATPRPNATRPVTPAPPLELALAPTNSIEQQPAWGEVRITDPGADLKVTKVDVVPLQIEAAANQALTTVNWFSTINGTEETRHELPPPPEPRYATYHPSIYLDELNLSDWDVLTYYAKANTSQHNAYASEVFFLEVRPFREDILKMPGGEGGKPYQSLNEITTLINRQQHIIRQTHQHLQRPPEQKELQAQDRKKLAQAEGDLRDSVQHLYAKMATEMENKPIGEALDNLAKAQQSLGQASQLLQDNVMNQAQNQQRSALSALVAARKMFQKAVSDDPKAFAEAQEGEETPPVADNNAQKLNAMAEFRNEAKAAQEFVRKTLEQQKALEQQAKSAPLSQYGQLGAQQEQLRQSLENFQGQHPRVFKDAQAQAQPAQQAMQQAAQALQGRRSEAPNATEKATQQLEKFSAAMQRQAAEQQLADAYKLKQMLDQQIQALDQQAKADAPPGKTDDPRETAQQARETIDQLKKTAEQEPTRDAFGQPLRDALSGQNKADLDAKLEQLQRAQDAATQQQQAAQAKEGLDKIRQAFEASQPQELQAARKADALQPQQQDRFSQGLAELDSLIKQLENQRSLSPQDQAKQGKQALYNLQSGLRSQQGDNSGGNQIRLRLQQLLEQEGPLDLGDLKKLMEQLQRFSVESSEQLAKKEDKPELTNMDPARLPPAYRGRIQKYFQRLSEP